MNPLNIILKILAVLAEAFKQRNDRMNTPEMQKSKRAKQEMNLRDDNEKVVSKALKSGNLEEIRRRASE